MKLKTKKKEIIVHKVYLSELERIDLIRMLKTVCFFEEKPNRLTDQCDLFINILEKGDNPKAHGMGSEMPEMLKPQCD